MGVVESAFIAGTALNLYGQYKSSRAEADAYALQASLKEAQATEVLRRAESEKRQILRAGEQLLGDQAAAQAGMGGSVSSGNLVMAQAEANYMVMRDYIITDDEAQYQAQQLRMGASLDRQLGKDKKRAGLYNMGATLLTAGLDFQKARGALG